MKFKVTISLFSTLILLSFQGAAQFTFSVGTGVQHNTATFGFKYKKFVPQIGLQMLHGTASLTETGKRTDTGSFNIISYEDKMKFSGTLFLPSIGLKYYIKESDKLKAYAILNYTKYKLTAKLEDSNDPEADEELQKLIKRFKVYGGQLGFGTEYFIDNHFSLGGEFGFMLLHVKYKNESTETLYDPNTGNDVQYVRTQNAKVALNPTYAKMSLNFYFGK